MPMPWTYHHATKEFRSFLSDAKERMSLVSDNSTYTAVDAVFQVFRRRLTPKQVIAFADILPSILRAIFVYRWDPEARQVPFASVEEHTREAQAIRKDHNLTPDNAIEATAWALRRHVNQHDLDRVLAQLPQGAIRFWEVDVSDPKELEQRII
ncbi:DUF2267 domain-containing protein [uncultured Roseobacter sp.]|uniref:DUF2267 domain-containing protein n=2 Tax=uncultured Roseobacter sp. TaxID=114847 RepID=UPI00261CAA19|nr:DUF2267 domain-containing protein [uncultured Roseobacter sp.]